MGHRWLIWPVCLLFLALTPLTASASGVALRWDKCHGDGGVAARAFACDVNTGVHVMTVSAVPSQSLPDVERYEVLVDLSVNGGAIPAWWQFFNAGTCRQTSLLLNTTPRPDAVNCQDWTAGGSIGAIASVTAIGPNRIRIRCLGATSAAAVTSGLEHHLFNLTFNNAKSVGTGSCSGCLQGATIHVPMAMFQRANGERQYLYSPAFGPGSNLMTWNGGAADDPAFPDYRIVSVESASVAGGSIVQPSGHVNVPLLGSQDFAILSPPADSCLHVTQVELDGASLGTVANVHLAGVTDSHVLRAVSATAATITTFSDSGGVSLPVGTTVAACGSGFTATPQAAPCHQLQELLVDGVSAGAPASLTFPVARDHVVEARFVPRPGMASPQPSAGLVGWWDGEGNARDALGANHGTASGPVGYAAGTLGTCFALDGSSHIQIADAPALDLTTGLTLEAWVRPTSSIGRRQVLSRLGVPGHSSYELSLQGAQVSGMISGTGTSTDVLTAAGPSVPIGAWTHVAMTFDTGMWRLYLNGVEAAAKTSAVTALYAGGSSPLRIGARPLGGENFVGQIDDASVYSRALANGEIRDLYEKGLAGVCRCADLDADGWAPRLSAGPGDCDDHNPEIHPAAADGVCNGVDNDCDGSTDNGTACACIEHAVGLRGWWRGETNTLDESGHGSGVWTGTASYTPGEVGQAFTLSGSSYVVLSASSDFVFSDAMTAEAWVKVPPGGGGGVRNILGRWSSNAQSGVSSYALSLTSGGQLQANVSGNGTAAAILAGPALTPDQWTHVAMTFAAGELRLHVNGAPVAVLASGVPSLFPAAGNPLTLGRSPSNNSHFDGQIDEPAVYDRALSTLELAAIHARGPLGMCGAARNVDVPSPPRAPTAFQASLPRPNPARGPARLPYALPRAGRVSAAIFDITGRRVLGLLDEASVPAGEHELTWDGSDHDGRRVPAGIYQFRIRFGSETLVRRIVLTQPAD